MHTFRVVLVLVAACIVPAVKCECASLVVNNFGDGETVTKNALGELSGDDGTAQSVSIVNNRLIIQTKPNVEGGWYTDISSGCKNVSASKYDQVEVVWGNSSPSTLVLSVLWADDDTACQTRSWKTTSAGSDSGVIGDSSKTTTFALTSQMTDRLHTIYLGLPSQESSVTYSIRSIRLVQSGACPAAATTSTRSSNTALSVSLTLVLVLVTFTFSSMLLIN